MISCIPTRTTVKTVVLFVVCSSKNSGPQSSHSILLSEENRGLVSSDKKILSFEFEVCSFHDVLNISNYENRKLITSYD